MKLNCIKANTTAAGHKALFGLLREQNDGSGRHIFVVPDRYTLGVEREICETLYPEGVFNVDVCSFTRLAQKALGRKNKTCLSKEGTVLLLNRVIEELGDKLVYYKNIKSVAFSREMFASIAAIRSSKIGADELGEKSNTVSGSIGDKLKDIALIYKAYEEELKGKYFDTVTRVDWLTENIGNSDYVKNSHIYILGFNVYSNAQLEFIKRAVIFCPSVSISYCDGTSNHNSECFPMRQAEELLSYCEKAGVNIVIRESNEVLPEVFGFLHREMFAPGNAVFRGNSVESVKIDAEPNVYEEVKAAAREIRYLVFEREYRYKDIAVAVNNSDLTDLITKTFSRYGIPHFIDKKYADYTFERASEFASFSEAYFSRLFHKQMGMTFSQYLNNVRIRHAVEIMRNEPKVSMTELSIKTGYTTIRNFNRMFRTITGYAPRELPEDFHFEDKYGSEDTDPTLEGCTLVE